MNRFMRYPPSGEAASRAWSDKLAASLSDQEKQDRLVADLEAGKMELAGGPPTDDVPDTDKEEKMKINLSLENPALYAGCEIETVAGRLNLKTPVADAVNRVGRNIAAMLEAYQGSREEVTLTGPMAVWAYLIVFHAVVHRFSKVYYDDGRSGAVLIAAHG